MKLKKVLVFILGFALIISMFGLCDLKVLADEMKSSEEEVITEENSDININEILPDSYEESEVEVDEETETATSGDAMQDLSEDELSTDEIEEDYLVGASTDDYPIEEVYDDENLLGAGNSMKLPTAVNNLTVSLIKKSYIVSTSDGYMRVLYNGEKIGIEYYDNNFNLLNKKWLNMELPVWGGFYAGNNAYYIAEGQHNPDENDNAEVLRVIKFDKNWNRIGAAKITGNTSLFGGEVGYIFHYGNVEMTEIGSNLYLVTGHRGYVDPSVGQGHQGFLMFRINTSSMTGSIIKSDLWHSFAQYIKADGANLYVLEQSEGSRYTKLSKIIDSTKLSSSSISVLDYGGSRTSAWAIACYASVDDMAVSGNNILGVGTSIDQSKYDEVSSDTSHNIYITVTPKNNFTHDATTVKWLTNYGDEGKSFLGVNITKINDNKFMVAWEETGTNTSAGTDDTLSGNVLHYVFIDGAGNKLGKEYTAAAPISDCHPILNGSKIVYCASSSNMVNFYTIDTSNGAFTKKTYRVAGENATWEVSNGVLTISGYGDLGDDTSVHYRYPVSSTARYISYSSSDNDWKPIRENVTKIVIKSGITSIPEKRFAGFGNVTEVNIENGVKSIGKQAFYSCGKLKKITIPNSVTSIGEDILWTGYYWIGNDAHVTRATIYAEENSYAAKYARDNNISFEAVAADNSQSINSDGTVNMYRLYNPNSGEHFYTASTAEKNHLVSVGWNYEGIGWKAPASSNTPVYRLYNPNAGDHHYTMDKGERDMLISVGWNDEGIGWDSDDAKGVPLYRQYNPNAVAGSHNYTTNKAENDHLASIGWNAEGVGWYGVK